MKGLFKKKTVNLYHKILNKDGFIKKLSRLGYGNKKIEEEWQKIEKTFAVYYLQVAYDKLSKEKQQEVGEKIELTKRGAEEFVNKMTALLTQNPDLVDQKTVIEEAARLTLDAYSKSFKKSI